MENIDLNLENYNLTDLLNLFKLDIYFKEDDLKTAKTMALKTHPDKSRLDQKFFVFFMRAYQRIEQIYNFRKKKEQDIHNVEYSLDTGDITSEGDKELLKKLDGKDVKDFNKWFNKMFENTKVGDGRVDNGYGDWLKSEEDRNDVKVSSTSEFGRYFNQRKKDARELVVHKGVEERELNVGYNLNREGLEEYSSGIFSKLSYEDLKKAHTETVVPVTEEDFLIKEKYKNVDALNRVREKQDVTAISLEQSRMLLQEKRNKETYMTTNTAYNLLRQDEEVRRMNDKWWMGLKQLDDR
jgi:hypothetical protein